LLPLIESIQQEEITKLKQLRMKQHRGNLQCQRHSCFFQQSFNENASRDFSLLNIESFFNFI